MTLRGHYIPIKKSFKGIVFILKRLLNNDVYRPSNCLFTNKW